MGFRIFTIFAPLVGRVIFLISIGVSRVMGMFCVQLAFIMSCQGSAAGTLVSKTSNSVPVVTKHPSPSLGSDIYQLSVLFQTNSFLHFSTGRERRERI